MSRHSRPSALEVATDGCLIRNERSCICEQTCRSIARWACCPSVAGEAAREEYVKQIGAEFVVLSNNRKMAFVTDALPQNSSLVDYCVFPANLAWTMAFTHEEGWLGPYFARHRDFDVLNEVNVRKVRKLQESEEARVKGWR